MALREQEGFPLNGHGECIPPEYGGMSEEAFMAGCEVMGIMSRLTPEQQAEVLPALISQAGYALRGYPLELLESILGESQSFVESIRKHTDDRIASLNRPETYDYNY